MKQTKETSQLSITDLDPIVLIRALLRRWTIVLLIAVAAGVSTYIIADLNYQPVYQTNTTFVVTGKGSSSTVYSNLTSTSNLASVFTELLNSSMMKKTMLREMNVDHFDGTVETSVIPGTNLIMLKTTASDPWTAFVAAQTIIDQHEQLTYKVVDSIVLEVLQHPVMPTAPSNRSDASDKMRTVMRAAAILTVLVMAVQICSSDTVRSEKEAQERIDCTFLGQIPHERKHKTLRSFLKQKKTSILIINPLSGFRFVEAVRKLRRRVEKRMHDDKVLMVISLLENEGKSTVAVNLALAMEQSGKRVLLIDCDLRKPACRKILEQEKNPYGIRDVLSGRVGTADAVVQYGNKELYLLLENQSMVRSADLVGSDRMRELIDWARHEFDFVVVDMPPLYAAADAEIMNDMVDASILVVRQNVSSIKALNKVISSLDHGKARLLGCVLNNVYSNRVISGEDHGQYGHYNHNSQKNR